MIIYKITNNINGKIYVGQTTRSLRVRWNEHCSKYENCKRLNNAINKYGKHNFTIEKIDIAQSIEELNKKEVEWILKFNSTDKNIGYNIESGGLNKFSSIETIDKLKHRKHPSEFCDNWSLKLKGIKKWSNEGYKKPKSKEHCLNISKNCHTKRAVTQFDINGMLIKNFKTIKEASNFTGVKRNSISACCVGRTKTGGGFIWMYTELSIN